MTFRFFHKLLIGFALVGIMTAVLALLGLTIIQSNTLELKLLLDQQVKPLANISMLQGKANGIRKQESELTKIKDYFAITGSIENLSQNIRVFEQRLFDFLEMQGIRQDAKVKLLTAWRFYRMDLDRTIAFASNGELGRALDVSIFSSSPRFSVFAEHLEELTQLLQRQADAFYAASVRKQARRQTIFIFLSALTFISGIVLAYVYAKSLSRRLDLLNLEANRLAGGRLDREIQLKGGDEISELATSFDRMRRSIQQRERQLQDAQISLEERVEERTREYNESNRKLKKEIKERIRIESALRESRENLQKAQRIAGLGSWELDVEQLSITISETLSDLLGIGAQTIPADMEHILKRFVPVEDQEKIRRRIDEVSRKEDILPSECRIKLPSGEIRHIWVEGEFIHNENNQPQRILGTVLDITERKQMEEQLLRSQRVESIGQLAGGIAHDFNNLLTSIVGNIHLAKVAGTESKRDYCLAEISNAAKRAMELSGKLLTFAKGGVPLSETIYLDTQIQEIAKIALTGTSIDPKFDIADDLLPVDIDRSQIGQVLQNLIINARDAMPDGGSLIITANSVTLADSEIASLPAGQYNEVRITDTGSGIREEDLPHIFDLYFSRKERGPDRGTGLGLAICYSIIKKHKGDIFVQSSVDHGTTFIFYLPVSSKEPHQEEKGEALPVEGHGRVLVMDDEEIIRDVAGSILETLGYEVDFAVHGEEAIEAYATAMDKGEGFDAVILDLTIRGGMGGMETIQRLKVLDPNVKAIVSSGYTAETDLKDFEKHGFSAAIPKPYNVSKLSRTLDQLIKGES